MTAAGTRLATFTCWECGNCCRVRGTVRVNAAEVDALAAAVGCSPAVFAARYTTLLPDRRGLTLRETTDGACVFLGRDGGCRVYAARPQQCRDFPYTWNYPGWEAQCVNQCALPLPETANQSTAARPRELSTRQESKT